MADDSRQRSFRSNEPYRRAAEPPRTNDGGGDPLAELARLIGQSDPFAEFGRASQREAPPAPRQPSNYRQQDDYAHPDNYPPAARDDWRHQQAQDPQANWDPAAYEPQPHASSDHGRDSYQHQDDYRQEPSFQNYDPRLAPDQHYADQAYADPRHGDPRYADPRQSDPRHADAQYGELQYADQHYADEPHPDERGQGAKVHGEPHGEQQDDDYRYQDDAPLDPRDDEAYDDAPGTRRRGGLATALALVGCAMLGTAGAYAYRSYVSTPGSTQPPPVITADTSTPTKIIPATAGDPQGSRTVQERLATAGKEQIVSKQEEPVALRELGTQTAPRVVLPAPVPVGGSQPGGSEPKKVRTVTIRPDGNDMSGRPVGALPPGTQPPATTRAAPPPPAPRAAAPTANGGANPISLDPQTTQTPAPNRIAAAPPPARSAPETTASAGFVVQLSSQKTEAEAQSSFRSLQAKFPSELGDRQPIIRRADLGSKGVFYRTMVGPFASAQEASQFCASYKAAGGQCMVPSN
jgi:SPOR domain